MFMVRMIAWRRTVSLERHPLPARPAAGEDRLRGDKRSRPSLDQYLDRLNEEFRFVAHALDSQASNNLQESEILGLLPTVLRHSGTSKRRWVMGLYSGRNYQLLGLNTSERLVRPDVNALPTALALFHSECFASRFFRSKLPSTRGTYTLHEESFDRKAFEILVGGEETRNQIFSGKITRNQNKSPHCLQDCTSNKQFQSTRNYGPYATDRSCYSFGLVWIICHAGS